MRSLLALGVCSLLRMPLHAQAGTSLDQKWALTVAFEDSGKAAGIVPEKNLLLFRSNSTESSRDNLAQRRLEKELLDDGWSVFRNVDQDPDTMAISRLYKHFSDSAGTISGLAQREAMVVRINEIRKMINVQVRSPYAKNPLFKVATPVDEELINDWQARKGESGSTGESLIAKGWTRKLSNAFTRDKVVYLKAEMGYTLGGHNSQDLEPESYTYLSGSLDLAPQNYRDGLGTSAYYAWSLPETRTGVGADYGLSFQGFGGRLCYHTKGGVGFGVQLGFTRLRRSVSDDIAGLDVSAIGRPALEEYPDTRLLLNYSVGLGNLAFQCLGSISVLQYVSFSLGGSIALAPNEQGERLKWVR